MSSRPLPSPSPCIQTLPCSPKPGAPLQEGWMGGAHSLSGWPPQKLTVSEFLNRRRSPAWRLNSALSGVKQRRQDVRENFLHAALRNSQFLKWFSGQAIPPSPAVPSAAKPSARVRLQPCAGRGAPEQMRRNARGPGGNCGRIDSAHLTCRNS